MPPSLPFDPQEAIDHLKAIQLAMRGTLVHDLQRNSAADRSAVASDLGGGDTIYAIDQSIEHTLVAACSEWAREYPFLLVAEGLGDSGRLLLPEGAGAPPLFRVIVDPVDGTRGLMYDKRSAWILAAVAPERGDATNLSDVVAAVQTEAPITKQYLADVVWAVAGRGAHAERHNVLTGDVYPLSLSPSQAPDLAHGFASLSKFFPGRKPIVAEIEEQLITEVDGPRRDGKVRVFDDQYISSGGQLYELMAGHDRFNGDIRPALMRAAHLPGSAPGMAAHPYDICTELIAREAGVVVTGLDGSPLRNPLTIDDDVAWLGYANPVLRRRLEPVLQRLFREYGLL
jgi:fructose-1,6-bisphosphatase/inositol monophosphatase family enzyme